MLIQLYFLLASFFKRGKGRHVSCMCSFFSINSKVKDLQHDFNVMWFQSSSALIMCLQNIFKDEVEQTKIKPASLLLDAIFCFFLNKLAPVMSKPKTKSGNMLPVPSIDILK